MTRLLRVLAPLALAACQPSAPPESPPAAPSEPALAPLPGGTYAALDSQAYGAFGRSPHAPKLGDLAPDFTLPNQHGVSTTLSELEGEGPIVLVFYRGFW